MATLVLTAIGTALGGPLGGAIGALLGQQADRALLAPAAREGPRLQDLAFTTSSYGAVLPRHYGRMRVGGTIIWATDLAETRHSQGGGKGRPAVTSYSYAASFAVALASRPLAGIGRIWADGALLRGSAGDLKVGGQLRFYPGHGDQPPDPLLAAAEGPAECPAYRGLAYVVFEDLQLGDFGNRLPTLSFEVFGAPGGEGATDLAVLGADAGTPLAAAPPLDAIAGLSVDRPLGEVLAMLGAVLPLGPAAASPDDRAFGARAGYLRSWGTDEAPPPELLRYYDVDRDYQAGIQRAVGQGPPARGQGGPAPVIEWPAALAATTARDLIADCARRAGWARQSLAWRTAELDPAIGPGRLVSVPGQPGVWRVTDWEWRASGVEYSLVRVPGGMPATSTGGVADPGRAALAGDRSASPTVLRVFELPWDGTGTADAAQVCVAASAAGPGWTGAALFADDGVGGLTPLGSTGRLRCAMGQALEALPGASPLLPDRASSVLVELVGEDLDLVDATGRQLAQGANRALLGAELIQFARAVPLGRGRWRLAGLLRGRGGTEALTDSHVAGEGFVLLDDRPVLLDAAQAGTRIAASGLGDAEPVRAAVAWPGLARRPLSPVHPVARRTAEGALVLGWTRRARGAWTWADGTDVPLREDREVYEVLIGPEAAPVMQWQVTTAALTVPAALLASLRASAPGAPVLVRQRGSYGVSPALLLATVT